MIGQFVDECCERKGGAVVTRADISKAFKDWCPRQGEAPVKPADLYAGLEKRGFATYKSGGERGRTVPKAVATVSFGLQ